MSLRNVEVIRAGFEALNRRDLDAAFARVAPDCEFDLSRAVGLNQGIYDVEQWRGITREWLGAWESSHWEVHEYIDLGEHVITPVTNRLRGRDGIEVEACVTWLWTLGEGVVKRLAYYPETGPALQAAGRSEEAGPE